MSTLLTYVGGISAQQSWQQQYESFKTKRDFYQAQVSVLTEMGSARSAEQTAELQLFQIQQIMAERQLLSLQGNLDIVLSETFDATQAKLSAECCPLILIT